jgi:hypothetical protein
MSVSYLHVRVDEQILLEVYNSGPYAVLTQSSN